MLDSAAETQAVRRIWEPLGLPGLIDVHVHFMPRQVMDKVWQFFDGVQSPAWPIEYRTEEADRLARLRSYGVLAFPSLVYPHKPAMAEWLNAWAADFASQHADVVRTATFFPEEGAGAYVARALDGGARLFKAHLEVGAYDPRDPLLDDVWGQLADAQVPVVVHCGDGPAPGPFTGIGPISSVLSRFPRLLVVVAHMGLPGYEDFLDLAARSASVRLDTTMAFTDFVEQLWPFPVDLRPRLLDLQDRVLLGSDFPNTPYPFVHQLESLVRLDLGDDWLRAVLHDNAASMLSC